MKELQKFKRWLSQVAFLDRRPSIMNIVVCLKQVPDTTAVKIDPKTGTLIRDGVPSIINPEDKHAFSLQLQGNRG